MKKGYYVYLNSSSAGVRKKIDMQCTIFESTLDIKKIEVSYKKRNFINKMLAYLPFFNVGVDYQSIKEQIIDPDFVYIRRLLADRQYIKFLAFLKKQYPKCKIILEMYTYPYYKDAFCRNFKHFITHFFLSLKDFYNSHRQKKYIDRIVTYSRDEKIYGIETIQTTNGVDVKMILEKRNYNNTDSINIISVAYMQPHHGYERLIKGLYYYYQNAGDKVINYYLIGEGPEKKKYERLVKKYHLQENIHFVGEKKGEELEKYYDIADIAVGSLGGYKIGINLFSSLKLYEYFAKGLPILSGCPVNIIGEKDSPYICYFPNNSTPIDLKIVINYLSNLYLKSKEYTSHMIRNYSMDHVDISVAMKSTIDYIDKNEK